MSKKYIIGVDSGTSIVKVVLFDLEGNEVAVSARKTPVEEKHFGWSEYDMDIEWREVMQAFKDLFAKTGVSPDDIAAIGICGKCGGVCLLDKNDKPVRLGILWNDARCADMTGEWIANGKMEKIFADTSNWLMTANLSMVVPWLRQNEPKAIDAARTFCSPSNWICLKLTGELGACGSDFFGQVGKDRTVNRNALKIEGIDDLFDKFPKLINPWEIAGETTAGTVEECGLRAGIPVLTVGWDVVGSTAGAGCIEPGQANIILGTSGVIGAVLPEYATSPMLGTQTVYNLPGMWLQMIAPLTGTPNSDWYVGNFTHEDKAAANSRGCSVYELFDEEVAKIPPGCNGTIYHPYLNAAGERAPFTDINARGNFFGLNLHSNRMVMLKAVYEGMAFSNKHCLEAYTYPVHELRLSGGGSKSPVWCQIFADICNVPISLTTGIEFGAKGSAWTAA